jgi:hypothetical protein
MIRIGAAEVNGSDLRLAPILLALNVRFWA